MDDGFEYHTSYKLATCSFNEHEHLFIKDLFQTKYYIICDIRIQGKYLVVYISKQNKSNEKFKQLIEPYITPSMKYKL